MHPTSNHTASPSTHHSDEDHLLLPHEFDLAPGGEPPPHGLYTERRRCLGHTRHVLNTREAENMLADIGEDASAWAWIRMSELVRDRANTSLY